MVETAGYWLEVCCKVCSGSVAHDRQGFNGLAYKHRNASQLPQPDVIIPETDVSLAPILAISADAGQTDNNTLSVHTCEAFDAL